MSWHRLTTIVGFAALLVVAIGCSDGRPQRVPISGKVLIDSKPLTYGTIQFVPTGARASQGTIDKDGRFTLTCFGDGDGAVLGQHTVTVAGGEPISSTKIRWHAPKKYLNPQTSGLTHQVSKPDDQVTINLTWAGGKEFIEVEDGEPEEMLGGPHGRNRNAVKQK